MALLSIRIRRCAAALDAARRPLLSSAVPSPPLHPHPSVKPPPSFPHQPRVATETTARSHPPLPAILRHECSSSSAASPPQRPYLPRQPWAASDSTARPHLPPPSAASLLQLPSSSRQPWAASEMTAPSHPPPLTLLQHDDSSSKAPSPVQQSCPPRQPSTPSRSHPLQHGWSSSRASSHPHQANMLAPPSKLLPRSTAGVRGYSTPGLAILDKDERNLPIILHPEARSLSSRMKILADTCVDAGALHLNIHPADYITKHNPILISVEVPGSNPVESILMAEDKGLVLIRSLPELLRNLHEAGFCISPLTPLTQENLAISSDGKFRIRSDIVMFVPLGGLEGGSISADYRNAGAVLRGLLELRHGQDVMIKIRGDLLDFFDLLHNCSDIDGYYICHHGALVPLNNRADVFMKLYHVFKTLEQHEANDILNMVPSHFINGLSNKNHAIHWRFIAINTPALKPWTCPPPSPAVRGSSAATGVSAKPMQPNIGYSKAVFLTFHRNVYCHKENSPLDLNLLLYALYPPLLSALLKAVRCTQREAFLQLKLEDNFK